MHTKILSVFIICISILLGNCSSDSPKTEILLSISGDTIADEIRLYVKNKQNTTNDTVGLDVKGIDLVTDPVELIVHPTDSTSDQIAFYGVANNIENGSTTQVMTGVVITQFIPLQRVEVSLNLRSYRRDNDGDWFSPDDSDPSLRDCKDINANQNPFALENCDDRIDNNCDGTANEGCPCQQGDVEPCYPEETMDFAGKGECQLGLKACDENSNWGPCEGYTEPQLQEECGNNKDDDCDNSVDEDCPCDANVTPSRYCWVNTVAQDFSQLALITQGPLGLVYRHPKPNAQTYCKAGIQNCTNGSWSRCSNDMVGPAQDDKYNSYVEIECDGYDDDCDGLTDENGEYLDTSIFDNDNDNYTECGTSPDGGTDTRYRDCDEANDSIYPNAQEICENGTDEDCRYDWGSHAGEYVLVATDYQPGDLRERDWVCNQQGFEDTCADYDFYSDFNQITGDCHFNEFAYWQVCLSSGSCAIPDEACFNYTSQGEVAQTRSDCSEPVTDTCRGTIPGSFSAVPFGEDSFNDCGRIDCDNSGAPAAILCSIPYFWGVAYDPVNCVSDTAGTDEAALCRSCYLADDVFPEDSHCDGSSMCLGCQHCMGAVDKGSLAPEGPACSIIRNNDPGCTQDQTANYDPAPLGLDPFGSCSKVGMDTVDCSSLYYGWIDNTCYRASHAHTDLCDGNYGCLGLDLCIHSQLLQQGDALPACQDVECIRDTLCQLGNTISGSPGVNDLCFFERDEIAGKCDGVNRCGPGGACLLINGQTCTNNNQCVTTHCDTLGGTNLCCESGECCNANDGDCPGEWACEDGIFTCYTTCTAGDSECKSGSYCYTADSTCYAGGLNDRCLLNSECDSLICNASDYCANTINQGLSGCDEDADCTGTLICDEGDTLCCDATGTGLVTGACCTSNSNCGSDYCRASTNHCVNGNHGSSCDDDGDCDDGNCVTSLANDICQNGNAGSACDIADGDNDCDSGNYCVDSLCEDGTSGADCADNNDCDSGLYCVTHLSNPICQNGNAGSYCDADNDCDSGNYCVSNVCRTGAVGQPCDDADDNNDCDAANYCNAGTCAADVNDGNVCDLAGDCISNYCNNGYCCGSGTCCASNADCSGSEYCDFSNQCSPQLEDGDSGCNEHSDCENLCDIAAGICCSSGDCCNDNDHGDCDSGYYCDTSNNCQTKLGSGSVCPNDNNYCSSGNCNNNICCASGETCCTDLSKTQCSPFECDTSSSHYYCYTDCNNNDSLCSGTYVCIDTTDNCSNPRSDGSDCAQDNECVNDCDSNSQICCDLSVSFTGSINRCCSAEMDCGGFPYKCINSGIFAAYQNQCVDGASGSYCEENFDCILNSCTGNVCD